MTDEERRIRCHFEGHLNSPITDDEVSFVLDNEEFICERHKRLKHYFKTHHPSLKSYKEVGVCPWKVLEHVLIFTNIKDVDIQDKTELSYLLEAAVWNLTVHHKAYYGVDMQVAEKIDRLKQIISRHKEQFDRKRTSSRRLL